MCVPAYRNSLLEHPSMELYSCDLFKRLLAFTGVEPRKIEENIPFFYR